MRAVLEFELPEEHTDYMWAVHGEDYWSSLLSVDEKVRGWIKYGHSFDTVEDALEGVREFIRDALGGVPLEDV
jgi:hypothetical protein